MEKKIQRKDWSNHLAAAAAHAGGVRTYCREQNISSSRFYYWKKKLKGARREIAASAFAAVEVIRPTLRSSASLPDPKWLAEFLRAYAGGSQ